MYIDNVIIVAKYELHRQDQTVNTNKENRHKLVCKRRRLNKVISDIQLEQNITQQPDKSTFACGHNMACVSAQRTSAPTQNSHK